MISNSPDPVAEAGRLLAVKDENGELAAVEDGDMLFVAEEVIGSTWATSLAGAMAQAMLVLSDARSIHSWVDQTPNDRGAYTPGHRARVCNEMLARIEHCTRSIVAVLAKQSGIDPAEVGGEVYCIDGVNPHDVVADALAALRRSPAAPLAAVPAE